MQLLNARLIATTGSAKNAADAMQFLNQAAQKQSVDVITLANGYTRLLPAVNNGVLSMQEMRTILTLANDNIKAFGLSTGQTADLFLGLSQSLGSGVVSMENLNQITEKLPGVFTRMEKSMGLATGELRKLVGTGTLVTRDILPALTEALRANEGAAAKLADTIDATTTRMNNAIREFSSTIAELLGITKALSSAADTIAESLTGATDAINIAQGAFDKVSADGINKELIALQEELTELIKLTNQTGQERLASLFAEGTFSFGNQQKEIDARIELIEKLQDELGARKQLAADIIEEEKAKKAATETIKKQSKSLAALVKTLEFEIKVARLGDRQRAIEIAKRKAITAIMKDTKRTQAQVVAEYQKEIKAIEKLTGTLFDLEEAERRATDEAEKLSKESLIAAENIQESLADAISDVVSNLDDLEGVGKRVFNNIVKFGIDAFSQIAAQKLIGAFTGGVGGGAGGVGGGAAASGLGGLGGIVNQIGSSPGFGGVSPDFIGPSLPGTGVASAASAASAAGPLISASLSTILSTALPIAAIAAVVIPLALSAFKKEGVKASEFASEFGGATTFGSKRQSTEFAQNLFSQLSAFTGGIQQAGGAQFQGNIRGGLNTKGGGGFLTIGETRINFDPENAEQAQEAFNDLAEILLDTAIIADQEVAQALRNLQFDGLSAAEAIRAVGIASGVLADQFNKQLEQQILKLTDARAFETQQIEMQTAALKKEAIAIGANVELVEKLGQLRLDQINANDAVEQVNVQKDITKALEASRKEAQKLSQQFAKIAIDLKQTALSLQLGSLSALSPEQQLDISRQAFTDLSRKAALGDVAAAQELPGAASAFLEESRNFNASNAAFKSDFASVQTGLTGAGDVFNRQSENQAGVVDAINNSINANSSGQGAIVQQLSNLSGQIQTQSRSLKDLTIKMNA